MFDNKYITKGINSEISIYLQCVMWSMIDSMKVSNKDYLQVFELKRIYINGKAFQQITHRQEQPKYENTVFVSIGEGNPVETKVFVIDDYEYCTMLLAEEY